MITPTPNLAHVRDVIAPPRPDTPATSAFRADGKLWL